MFSCATLIAVSQNTTLTLNPDFDNSLGYHDGWDTDVNVYENTIQTAAYANLASGTPNYNRALLHFDLSGIPTGATIVSAKINLYASGNPGLLIGHFGTNNSATLQRATNTWNHSTVTWNNQPLATDTDEVVLANSTSLMQDYLNLDVKNMVEKMILPNANNGFLFKQQIESFDNGLVFCSSDFSDNTKWPKLIVEYRLEKNSINEISQSNNFKVSQNENFLLVTSSKNIKSIAIYDIEGRLVISYSSQNSTSETVNIQNLINEFYLVAIKTKDELAYKKFIVR